MARKTPPSKNPNTAGIQPVLPDESAISIAGISKDQTLAAIMTPAAKPSMPSNNFWLIFLKKKTAAAPSAVTNQVKQVAKKACMIGFKLMNHSTNIDKPLPPRYLE